MSREITDHFFYKRVFQQNKVLKLRNEFKKYPARCKSVHKHMPINLIFTAENRKNMHVGFTINVIQTALDLARLNE